jgi:hypothetical protein
MREAGIGRQAFKIGAVLAAVLVSGVGQAASPLDGIENAKDREVATAFLRHVEQTPKHVRRLAKGPHPEDHCWQTFKYVGLSLTAYRLTRDVKHLDRFAANFAILEAAMTKGPDGFLGWYGKGYGLFHPPEKPELRVDVIITSFRAVELLCRFIRVIDADPVLAKRFANARGRYLCLMTDHLVKKWDARGNYVDLGTRGAVYRTHAGLRATKAHLTQPHNKHSLIGEALLALYRLSGDDLYMRKAIQLGIRYKRCLTLKDGHYEWNYWDPAGAWDVRADDRRKWKHWIGVEHKGGYYSLSLSQAVRLHEAGLVFDKSDIARFVKTQTEMCWNGDVMNPRWARCDGTRSKKYMQGAYLCAALAPYDRRIAALCGRGDAKSRERERAERFKGRTHGWRGGVVAEGYVNRLIDEREEQAGAPVEPTHEPLGKRFLAKRANRLWMAKQRFTVKPPGYVAPRTPAAMKGMPGEPRGRALD